MVDPKEHTPKEQTTNKTASSLQELFDKAKVAGSELTDEDLDQITGGWSSDEEGSHVSCISCGSTNVKGRAVRSGSSNVEEYECLDCGETWSESY